MSSDTKDRLFLIAIKELAKNGKSGFKLSKIAEEAGIKTPSIYAFFKSKKDLIDYTINRCDDSIKRNSPQCDISDDIHTLLFNIFIHYINEFSKEPLLSYYIFLAKESLSDKDAYQRYNALLYSVEVQISFIVNEKISYNSEKADITNAITSVIIKSFPSVMLILINEGEKAAIYEVNNIISFSSLLR